MAPARAGYDLPRDKLYGHVTTRKGRTEFLAFARYLRSLHPADVRIAIGLGLGADGGEVVGLPPLHGVGAGLSGPPQRPLR